MEKQIRPKDKVQSILKSINTKTSEILSDRKNSNQLIDLIDLLQKYQSSESKGMNKEDHSTVLLTLCRCLTKIFTNFIDSRELILYKENSDHINSIKNLNKYKSWLIKLYETVVEEFLNILSNKNSTFSTVLRKSVLQSVIKFIEEEGSISSDGIILFDS
ncbi:type II transmembrane protein [Sarcoptes scabiei]|nr:type II transmembrane protein [Sarcoptes scabiei]